MPAARELAVATGPGRGACACVAAPAGCRAAPAVAFRFSDDLAGTGGGGGFDEIGSEDNLLSTFMDMDKIAGADPDRDRDRATETSSPLRPAKHRHSASFDGFRMGASVGGQHDSGGGLFGEVMEAMRAKRGGIADTAWGRSFRRQPRR